MKRQVMVRSEKLTKSAIITLFSIIISVFCTNVWGLHVSGSDNQTSAIGGASKGGDITMGGVTLQCTATGACTITQAPKGGEATGGNAAATTQQVTPVPEPTPEVDNFVAYENTTYGVIIQHPPDWQSYTQYDPMYSSGNYIVGFTSPDASARLDIEMEDSDQTLQEYATSSSYGDPRFVEVTKSEPTTLADYPAYELVYTSDKYDNKIMHQFVKVDGRIYIITYGSETGKYSENLPTAQKMINTFQIINTPTPSS
jgi:hypothetical protein